MRFRFFPIALTALAALAASPLCLAAQSAKVNSAGAEIHSLPDPSSSVIGSLNGGDFVRVSSEQKDGWYRVLMKQSPDATAPQAGAGAQQLEFGWVSSDSIEPLGEMQEFHEVGVQYTAPVDSISLRHHWVILTLFDGLAMTPGSLSGSGFSGKAFMSMEYGLQLGYRLSTLWTLSLYGTFHQFTHSINGSSYVESGKDAALLLEYTFIHALPWKVGFALGGGISPGTQLAVTTGSTTTDATPFSPLLGLGKLTARAYFANHFALETEVGYRYLAKTNVTFGSTTSAVYLGAPFAGAGLQLEF